MELIIHIFTLWDRQKYRLMTVPLRWVIYRHNRYNLRVMDVTQHKLLGPA